MEQRGDLMNTVIFGIEIEAIVLMREFRAEIPARYIAMDWDKETPEGCAEETIRFSARLPAEDAVSRIAVKIKKAAKDADLVFLLSEITGARKTDLLPHIAKLLEGKTVVSVVWYPWQKHGKERMLDALYRLEECSAVAAFQRGTADMLYISHLVQQIYRMCTMSYTNADADAGLRTLRDGGLLHIAESTVPLDDLQYKRYSPTLYRIRHNHMLDTLLDGCRSALMNIRVPKTISPGVLRYLCEFAAFSTSEKGELNLNLFEDPDLADSVRIEVLATGAVTECEISTYYYC